MNVIQFLPQELFCEHNFIPIIILPNLMLTPARFLARLGKCGHPLLSLFHLCLTDEAHSRKFLEITHQIGQHRLTLQPYQQVDVIRHDDVAQQVKGVLVAIKIKAVEQGNNETGGGEDG